MQYIYANTEEEAKKVVAEWKAKGYNGYVVGNIMKVWEVRVWKL